MGKRRWCRRFFLLLAVGFYALAVFFCRAAEPEANRSRFLLNQSIDAATAEDIYSRELSLPEPVGFCFWGENGVQRISCPETGSSAKVTQVCLSGNPELLDAGILAWQAGCLLDTDTAQILFGTADCGGQNLLLKDKTYRVLGTFSALQPTLLTVAEEEDGAVLNRCILSIPATQSGQTGENFLLRHNLQGTAIDTYSPWMLLRNWMVLCLLLSVFSDFCRNRKKRSWISLTMEGIAMFIILNQIQIPANFLPGRWSDFSFWGTLWDAQKENWYRLLLNPMGQHHLQLVLNMVKSILSSTAAFFMAAWTLRRERNADPADRR